MGGRTSMDSLEWLSVCVMLPAIGIYQYASEQQKKRQSQSGVLDSCCWPLGTSRLPPEVEEPLTGGISPSYPKSGCRATVRSATATFPHYSTSFSCPYAECPDAAKCG